MHHNFSGGGGETNDTHTTATAWLSMVSGEVILIVARKAFQKVPLKDFKKSCLTNLHKLVQL